MSNHTCTEPGCGREIPEGSIIRDANNEIVDYFCDRSDEEHRLCAKLAESEAKVNELEAKLAEVDYQLLTAEHWLPPIQQWSSHERRVHEAARVREEARKKGAEHGE